MQINNMTLCRLTRREAEHLMMAPAVAGGWVDVHPDSRDAVEAVYGPYAADILALMPAQFADYAHRRVDRADAERILAALRRRARLSLVCEEHVAQAAAERLQALLRNGHD